MDSNELKRRITHLEGLPALPPLLASVLDEFSHRGDAAEALSILFDQHLFLRILLCRASDGVYSPDELTADRLSEALNFFGRRKARNWLLAALLPPLFPAPAASGLAREPFWKHALLCAHCAEAVCDHTGSPMAGAAFCAGLLHDIGKLVLDTIAPADYARAVDEANRQGILIRQAERTVFGVDHALVGKWLIERWGLSRSLADAVWLHDLPEAAPRTAEVRHHLIDAVALGNAMARKLMRGGAGDSKVLSITRDRLTRLGLSQSGLDLVRAETVAAAERLLRDFREARAVFEKQHASARHETERGEGLTVGLRTLRENYRMRREVQRYRILHELNMTLTPDLSPEGVVDVIVDVLQRHVRVDAGLCVALDRSRGQFWGKRWTALGTGQSVQIPVSGELAHAVLENGENAGQGLLRALTATEGDRDDSSTPVFEDCSMWPIPMMHSGSCVGYLVIPAGGRHGLAADDACEDLMVFAGACAVALHRAYEIANQREHSEELARALSQSREAGKSDDRTRRLESIRRIAAGIAHEVNNPLAVISGHAQLLEKHLDTPAVRRSLKAIETQSQRACQVLQELLKVAEPEFPTKEPVLLPYLLHQVAAIAHERLAAKKIAIVEDYEDGLPRVQIDQHQMSQVVLNLLANAEDAMAEGGTLTLSARTCAGNRAVAIAVADTGCGIAEEHLEHVFEPFYSVKPNAENLGLGLPVCLRIIENHGGALDVDSVVGEGTRMTITLPVASRESADEGALTDQQREAIGRLRSLPSRWWSEDR